MLIHALGPLRITADGAQIHVGGRRTKIVLAVLTLEANWVVNIDRLVDAVWGNSPPASARTQIRICVSGMRRVFAAAGEPDLIETHPSGYCLRLSRSDLDATVFEDQVDRARSLAGTGRLAEAVLELRGALSLWTGPALAGLAGPAVESGARRLEEARLRAIEERIRLELELGRHRDLIGELAELAAAHPYREHLHAQLMLALYRSHRTAESLAVYRSIRSTLVEELGIEPGPELSELEQAILLGLQTVEVC
ncbi:AfsR/SARP family transcriptional regulator [Streptomyces sp. NPDC047123]|uniref:AfsR/SARP family transcriptional regulator n=1 Tax=Streptomyces sp. NPDC047123 TaxID=3155622 RepID=UPI00340FA4D3